jgi:hypothetical protein
MPRCFRNAVARRDEEQIAQGRYRSWALGHCLVEPKDYLLRPNADGPGVGNRRDELGRRNIDWTAGRNAGRRASRHEQRDGD